MEFCRRWGVASAVRHAVWPESHPRDFVYLTSLCGRELLRIGLHPPDCRYPEIWRQVLRLISHAVRSRRAVSYEQFLGIAPEP